MIYTADFKDIKDTEYNIKIQTSSGTGTKTLVLGDSPFVTEMNTDEDILYSPMRTTGATVSIVTDTMPFDIYSGQATGTKVQLTNKTENKVEWLGYVTPCSYNMGFDYVLEEIELECIDGLSVLQYIPYRSSSKETLTILQIIFKCLKQSGTFKYLYISDNVQITSSTSTESVTEIMRVQEQNFFDEKDDMYTPDDDIAWNCLDVMAEICRFLGYTCTCEADSVYIIDYDAIKRNKNTYWRYDISGSSPTGKTYVTLRDSKYISTHEDYSDSGNSVSLSEVYNKVTVKDEFYTFDSLFPEFGDSKFERNITASSDSTLANFPSTKSDYFLLCDTIPETDKNGNSNNFHIMVTKSWRNRRWILVYKFFSSDVLDFHKYNSNRSEVTNSYSNSIKFSDLWDFNGAVYVRMFKKEISSDEYNGWRADYAASFNQQSLTYRKKAWIDLLKTGDLTEVNVSPYVVCLNHDSGHIGPGAANSTGKYSTVDPEKEDSLKYPFITLNSKYNESTIFGGSDAYLIIQGTFRYHDEENSPYPLADGQDNGKLKRSGDTKHSDQFFLWARLKWGDYYYTGEGWKKEKSDFKLWYRENGKLSRSERKNTGHYDKDFEFLDTAQANYGTSEKGYYIKAPSEVNLQGKPEFIIYANRDMNGDSRRSHWHPKNTYKDNFYCRYYSRCVFFKNLNIKAYISNGMLDDQDNDTDTVYSNYTDNGSVNEMDEITFKICTFDHKKPTYSSVDYLNSSGNSQYLECTYNKALYQEQNDTYGSNGTKAYLCQEEHYVYKMVSQYENPMVILELNLKNEKYKLYGTYTDKTISGKTYVPMTISTDYKYDKQTVKLMEKF